MFIFNIYEINTLFYSFIKLESEPGTMANILNPSYFGGGDLEGRS
jgi:hypothetical protein